MPEDLRALPKLRDSIPYLYLERCRITQTKGGVALENDRGTYALPVAQLCALMLGPGTTITHRAVVTATRVGCSLLWVGEEGVRFYAGGHGETRKGYALQRQAEAVSDPPRRLQVVERMYRMRFRQPLRPGLSIEQVRGYEGARVRAAYADAAQRYGVVWTGRRYDRSDWGNADPVNRALSAANSCLNGVCHAAVISAGYSPGLGFIHQGKQLSFVYDIADLYKAALSVPVAFAAAAEAADAEAGGERFDLERTVRRRCRQAFRNLKLLHRIVSDMQAALASDPEAPLPDGLDPDEDYALPTAWWDPPVDVTLNLGDGTTTAVGISGEGTGSVDQQDDTSAADAIADRPF